jgi:hypothetical protein
MMSKKAPTLVIGLLLLAACSSFNEKPRMNYYHGRNISEKYFMISRASAGEIEFQIRVGFSQERLYHIILDGDTPVAEGWFLTLQVGGQSYSVTLKPNAGLAFEPGKTYRLCVGEDTPESVQRNSHDYLCLVDYPFVFPGKS